MVVESRRAGAAAAAVPGIPADRDRQAYTAHCG